MKSFFAATLLGAAAASPLPFTIPDVSKLNTEQYNTMVAGVVYGAMQQKGEVAIQSCLLDAQAEAELTYKVFAEMEAGLMSLAFADMKVLVAGLPFLKLSCSYPTLAADIADLEAWALFFDRPESIVIADMTKNWLFHSIAMTKDMNKATTYWNAGEYFLFGEEVGVMAVILSQ